MFVCARVEKTLFVLDRGLFRGLLQGTGFIALAHLPPSGVLPTCILLDCRAGQTIKAGKYQQPQNGGPGGRDRSGTVFWERERRGWIVPCVMTDCVFSVDLVT